MTADELMDKYPNILKTYPSCGEGWYWLLDKLLSHLKFDIEHNKQLPLEIHDIKEKFGRLNIRTYTANEQQYAVIRFVENLSFHVCEECGTTKNIGHTAPWIKTLCSNCYNITTRPYASWTPELFDDMI